MQWPNLLRGIPRPRSINLASAMMTSKTWDPLPIMPSTMVPLSETGVPKKSYGDRSESKGQSIYRCLLLKPTWISHALIMQLRKLLCVCISNESISKSTLNADCVERKVTAACRCHFISRPSIAIRPTIGLSLCPLLREICKRSLTLY